MAQLFFDLLWRDRGVEKGLKTLARDVDKASRTITGMGRTAKFVGGALIAGLGIHKLGAGFQSSIEKASKFDATMRTVGVTSRLSGKGLAELTELAQKMGAETSFSAQGASDAMLALAKGGLSAAQMKAGALKETLTLATAGGLELGAAADYMVQGLSAFGLKAGEAGRVAAALAGGANASTASVESMGLALSQVGASAKTVGLSIEDTTAALAAFDNAGVKGSDAGTALKTFLSRLVPQTKKTQEAFLDLGITTFSVAAAQKFLRERGIKPLSDDQALLTGQLQDYAMELAHADSYTTAAQKKFNDLAFESGALSNQFFDMKGNIKSISEVSQVLQTALKGQSKEQKIATLNTLFGSDAMRAGAILADQGAEGLAKFVKATNDKKAAEELAKTATEGYAGAMERFTGSVETAQIKFGTKLLPVLKDGLDLLTNRFLPATEELGTALWPLAESFGEIAKGGLGAFIEALTGSEQTFSGFVDYINTHQADIVTTFVEIAQGAIEFGRTTAIVISGALRGFAAFAAGVGGVTTFLVWQFGAWLHAASAAFGWVPGMGEKIKKASSQFDQFAIKVSQDTSVEDGANAAADAIYSTLIPAFDKAGYKVRDLGRQQIWRAEQRDAANKAAIAIRDIGTRADGSQIKIKQWADVSKMSAGEQKNLKDRINDARLALKNKIEKMKDANASQGDLTKAWKEGKTALYNEFKQMGLSNAEAKKLAERYYKVPGKRETRFTQPGIDNSRTKAQRYKDDLDDLDKDRTVKVSVKFVSGRVVTEERSAGGGRNTRGGVVAFGGFAAGGYTGNKPPWAVAGAVHGDEHVIKSPSRRRFERKFPGYLHHINETGDLPGYRSGGRVDTRFSTKSVGTLRGQANALAFNRIRKMLEVAQDDLISAMTTGGDDSGITGVAGGGNRVRFRGGIFTKLAAANLRRAEQLAGVMMRVFQGGWRPRTSYSGTSHAGDAVDFQVNHSLGRAVRQVGWAAGDRTGLGNWVGHYHAVPGPRTGSGRGSAVWQYQDYARRRGARQPLRSPWGLADGGVMARRSLVEVAERGPERVLSPVQTRAFDRLSRVLTSTGGAVHVEYHFHLSRYVGNRDELRRELVAMSRRGELDVITRRR